MLTRRECLKSACSLLTVPSFCRQAPERADYTIDIAPFALETSARHFEKTSAYNSQVPGPVLRFREGQPATVEVHNLTANDEVVHWHGLFLPVDVDGAMEEGTPVIPPGGRARYTFTPRPSGFRWYHTHMFAGRDMNKGQYTGQHGFVMVEPRDNQGRYDGEFFLALHDWRGQFLASGDGSMNPSYDISTINGRKLGFGEPLRVKSGQRVLIHILNSSPTETHWISFAGHQLQVIALDGNLLRQPTRVAMLRLAPAERVSAIVEMNSPGVWILGEVRKHVMAAGMGIVVEYAESSGKPKWEQPDNLTWSYGQFAQTVAAADSSVITIPLVFKSKFTGHGDLDHWTINGKSYPHTETPILTRGQRYRLVLKNESTDDHPMHLHRHVFELRRVAGKDVGGILKDTVLVEGNTETEVEFTADNPGNTLFHCHQQAHMDMGFMMLFRYA